MVKFRVKSKYTTSLISYLLLRDRCWGLWKENTKSEAEHWNTRIQMSTISATFFRSLYTIASPPPSTISRFFLPTPLLLPKFRSCPKPLTSSSRKPVACTNSSEEAEVSQTMDEWLQKLPDKTKPLYSHSLPCIEAWLRSLGFYQSRDDRALWFVENPDWQAQLSLDITELHIRLVFNFSLLPFSWAIKIIFLVCLFGYI